MGGFGCGIDDAELASRVFDRLACRPAQMPRELASIKRADCCLSDASHDDDKKFLIFFKGFRLRLQESLHIN